MRTDPACSATTARVSRVVRNWPSVVRQELPERLSISGADAVARFAGRDAYRDRVRILDRAAERRRRFGHSDALVAAIQRRGGTIDRQTPADFGLLLDVLSWLRENLSSGYRLRQVPIPGMHTKWLGARRTLVDSLYAAITGEAIWVLSRHPTGCGYASSTLTRVRPA